MSLRVGDPAPDFALPLVPGEAPLRLADYQGERTVVLMFFPLAFSGVCTEQMCGVAADYSAWTDLGAEVVGISVDSPFVTQRFASEVSAPFPIVSDFNKDAARRYGVLTEDYFGLKGVSRRSVFVIDPSGVVAFSWIADNDEPPDLAVLLRAVREVE